MFQCCEHLSGSVEAFKQRNKDKVGPVGIAAHLWIKIQLVGWLVVWFAGGSTRQARHAHRRKLSDWDTHGGALLFSLPLSFGWLVGSRPKQTAIAWLLHTATAHGRWPVELVGPSVKREGIVVGCGKSILKTDKASHALVRLHAWRRCEQGTVWVSVCVCVHVWKRAEADRAQRTALLPVQCSALLARCLAGLGWLHVHSPHGLQATHTHTPPRCMSHLLLYTVWAQPLPPE